MVLALVAGACLPACSLNQQGVPPLRDAIAFPASALVDPGGQWLYVANANSDLRYNDGTLVAVSLARVTDDSQAGGDWSDCPEVGYVHLHSDADPDFCCRDLLDRTILNCDERRYIPLVTTVRIGSFSAGMVY
jgi:hypothetical protein